MCGFFEMIVSDANLDSLLLNLFICERFQLFLQCFKFHKTLKLSMNAPFIINNECLRDGGEISQLVHKFSVPHENGVIQLLSAHESFDRTQS